MPAASTLPLPPDASLLARLGAGAQGRRRAWRIVFALCLLYAAGFAIWYPRVPTNDDEAMYLRQARLLLEGSPVIVRMDPLTDAGGLFRPSTYAVGTAALMAPFLWAAGPRGAFLVPMLTLLAGVLLAARWIADEGRSPLFALPVLGFAPALVLGRICMSDAPSLAVVALGLWLFWRGLPREDAREPGPARGYWLAAGFVAGVSLVFRPTNALLFLPLFAGSVLRREPRCLLLVAGGLAGTAVRLAAHAAHFGESLYERASYLFSPETLLERLPLYLLGLLVLFPGGLVAAFAYRGRRRPELVATTSLFFLFYLLQAYGMTETGLPRRIVLALRYFLPLLPILAFATAEVAPRAWAAWAGAEPQRRRRRERAASRLLALGILGVACATLGVHFVLDRWSRTQARIAELIHEHTGDDSVLVTNLQVTRKYLRELERSYVSVNRSDLRNGDLGRLLKHHGAFYIVFLDRSDSEFMRRNAEENAEFIAGLAPPPRLELDVHASPIEHLRIWQVTAVREDSPPR